MWDAHAYERSRPAYPAEATAWLLDLLGSPREVAEIGAGTGKLTRELVARGMTVHAVEPSHEMRATLRREAPGATALDGVAERLPLPAASVDAALVAQAFHWFDAPSALREIARVLRPRGGLGLLWNLWDTGTEPLAAVFAIVRDEAPDAPILPLTTSDHPRGGWADAIAADESWQPLGMRRFAHSQLLSGADAVVERAASISAVSRLAPERRERALARVRAAARELVMPVELAYVCEAAAWRHSES
jgi:SAM-dependent methyltransferase